METSFRQVDLPIGDCISRGWDLTQENLGPLILFTLSLAVICTAVSFASFVLAVLPAKILPDLLGHALGALGRLVFHVLIALITAPLAVGYFIYLRKRLRGETPVFADFFGGFQYFLQIAAVTIVSGILILLGFLMCILPGLYLVLGYMFASFLVAGRSLDFWQAMETSRRAVTANFVSIFLLALVLIAINMLGLILCFVGLIITVPLSYAIAVIAYGFLFEGETSPGLHPGPVRIEAT